jgi:flagellar hook-associated protein 2
MGIEGDKTIEMSAITPLRFTGVSTFSEDFNSIVTRAVSIASLPIKQMQNQQSALLSKKQSLSGINSSLQGLSSAIEKLGQLGRTRALSVSSSNTTRVSVVADGLSETASYSITDITSIAKAASETSAAGFATANATAVHTGDSLELVVGGNTYALDLTGANHLNGLRDAINGSGAPVKATVLNTGSNYYLSVTANATGEQALEVRTTAGDPGSNILTSTNQGANAKFKLNGLDVEKTDNVVTDAIPGLTFTVLDKTAAAETVTLSATSSRGTLATALQAFVTAYNDTSAQLNQQIGKQAGLLSGDFIIGQATRTLRQVAGYQGGGDLVKSLADLGIELDRQGVMSFKSTTLYSLSTSAFKDAFNFLGSERTGFGGVSASLKQLSDPVTGFIKTQQDNYDASDRRIQQSLDATTLRIENMQLTLSAKLQQADALLAGLQSQQTALESAIKSVNLSTFGKQS